MTGRATTGAIVSTPSGPTPMRVLIVGDVWPDSFAENVEVSLTDVGHIVRCVPAFTRPLAGGGRLRARLRMESAVVPRFAGLIHHKALDVAEEFRPELILNLDFRLAWPMVERLRAAARCPVGFWYPDAVGNLGREVHAIAGYDAIFVKDSSVAERYRAMLGLNAHYLPEACNPRWHRVFPDVEPYAGPPVLLVAGNLYATRLRVLRRLADAGIGVALHGPPAPRWLALGRVPGELRPGPYLSRETKARSFRAAFAVLNSLAVYEADGLNCRLFEAAGSGAVLLTERRAQLPTLFAEDSEVLAFSSFAELVERVRLVSELEPAARVRIGDAASARAHRDHTYARRFAQIVAILGRG